MNQFKFAVYLAAGLFNAGERLHNLFLERALKALGRVVILPQREALKHFNAGSFNVQGIVASCQQEATNPSNVLVGNADGSDADSGTAVEYGMAIIANGHAVIVRTDFRTVEEQELGVNAMLRAEGTIFIYKPCFFTELGEVEGYYNELARQIHEAVLEIERNL